MIQRKEEGNICGYGSPKGAQTGTSNVHLGGRVWVSRGTTPVFLSIYNAEEAGDRPRHRHRVGARLSETKLTYLDRNGELFSKAAAKHLLK